MQSLSDAHKRSQRLWDRPCYTTPPQLWSTLAGGLSAQGIQNWAPNVLSALVIVTALLEFPLQGLDYEEEQAVWDAVDFKKGFSIVLDQSLSKHLTFSGCFLFLEKYVLFFWFWVGFLGGRGVKIYSLGTVWGKYQHDRTECGWLMMCILAACSILHVSAAVYKPLFNFTPKVVDDNLREKGIALEHRTAVTWIPFFHSLHCCLFALKKTISQVTEKKRFICSENMIQNALNLLNFISFT